MSPQKAKKLLSVHGKTFNWASYFLTPSSRIKAVALYAFCRRLDDLVDCAEDIDHESLRSIRLGLNNANHEIDHPILDDAVELIENHGIPLAPILDLLDGMISDCNDVFILNEKELIEYSYKVAGSVGLMMTPILGCRNPDAFRHAIDLGIAMQLTNIGRDVLEDAQRGRRYLPGDWCDFKSPETIVRAASDRTETETREKVSDAIRKIVLIAEKYYKSGLVGLQYIPGRNYFAIRVAGMIYRQIGIKLIEGGTRWWEGRTVISNLHKVSLTYQALLRSIPREQPSHQHDEELHKYILKYFQHLDVSQP